jgi:hypothetical protein
MNGLPPDIPRFYTSAAEWLACLAIILAVNRGLSRRRLFLTAPLALAAQTAFLVLTGSFNVVFWLPVMAAAVLLMFAFVRALCPLPPKDCAFHLARTFIMAEFAAAIEWQIHCWIWPDYGGTPSLFVPFAAGCFAVLFVLYYLLEKRSFYHDRPLCVTTGELCAAAALALITFGVSNLSFVTVKTPFSGIYGREILNMRAMVDLGGLSLLFAHYAMCRERRVVLELAAISRVLRTQYAQYQISKENIEIINKKHHDLKHQIAVLRAEPDSAKREAFLDEMENGIRAYETRYKTGSPVLDTILTSKGMYCSNRDISLTCVVDGAPLDFMDAMDICALFGNALDNAIESAERIRDKKRRLIHLTVARQKQFIIIRIENYFEGRLDFKGGLPLTTKGDAGNHGYGLKSMKQAVQKYGGNLRVDADKNCFKVSILIPLKG